jgi:hypothetical protein
MLLTFDISMRNIFCELNGEVYICTIWSRVTYPFSVSLFVAIDTQNDLRDLHDSTK